MEEGQSEESLIEARERSDGGIRTNRQIERRSAGKCCQISPLNLVCISHAFSAWPIRSGVYCPDILRYQVTDLIWLRHHVHLAEFGYSKYLIVPFLVCFCGISGLFGLAMGILAPLFLVKIQTMAQPNAPDMPPKCTKKGDRMWHFAIGLYLVELTPGSLRLTAIYQLVSTLSIIIFGPLVGDWVDANPRLKVAQVSLIIQNVAVIICGVLLLIMLELEQHIQHPFITLLEAVIIVVGSVADLSSIGTKIAVEKDWVVVIAGSDKSLLASTNSILRRIDLCCKILAPILVGQIMTYISKVAGVLFLAGWNVVSVFGEYYLLWKVFQTVSALSEKVFDTRHEDNAEDGSSVDLSTEEPRGSRERLDWMENEDPGRGQTGTEALVPAISTRPSRQRARKPGIFARFKKRVLTFKTGWHIYFRQSVARPGLALASLYFTVISFGAITTGYAYTQCLSESILSIVRGVGSLFGVFATFLYPRLRNTVGVVRCGLFSMSFQFSCLLLCVAAVFTPGSPFFLLPENSRQASLPQCRATYNGASTSIPKCMNQEPSNASLTALRPSNLQDMARFSSAYLNSTVRPTSTLMKSSSVSVLNVTTPSPTTAMISPSKTSMLFPSSSISPSNRNCSSNTTALPTSSKSFSYISIGLLLAGIVTSRLGLWLSDLTISQLFQEAVPEQERGIVAGMQNSFNSILSLIMFFLVIALPKPEHFGLLTLMSVCAVGIGGLLYASFAYKIRGHLFHFDKLRKFCGGSVPVSEPLASLPDDLDLEDEEEAMITGVLSTKNENFSY